MHTARRAGFGWVLCALLGAACGPPLGELLRDHHYEDAICAASHDVTGRAADRVGEALDDALRPAIHIYPISIAELEQTFGGKLRQDVRQLTTQFLFIRLRYSANRIPARGFGLSVRVNAGVTPLRIIDFSRYESLLALTRESVPTPRTGVYDSSARATALNIALSPFLLVANVFTLPFGRATYFRGHKTQVELPLDGSDWLRSAPDAYLLKQALEPSQCVDAMNRPCEAFFAIERPGTTPELESRAPLSLQFALSFGPLPIYDEKPNGPACFFEVTHNLGLPSGLPIAERLNAYFGNQMRTFRDLRTQTAMRAEFLRAD